MALLLILKVVVSVYLGFKLIWAALRWHVIRTATVLGDIQYLNKAALTHEQKVQGSAVIAGGSLAGLVTARILADYFIKIIIIEPEMDTPFRGGRVGQRSQGHKYMDMAIMIFRNMYPDFETVAKRYGISVHNGWARIIYGDVRFKLGRDQVGDNITASRVTLEQILRDLTFSYVGGALEVVQGVVTAVEASADGTHISAVKVRLPDTSVQSITAAFFADCSGPTSISSKIIPSSNPKWGPYPRHEYRPEVGYGAAVMPISKPLQETLTRMTPRGDPDFANWHAVSIFSVVAPEPTRSNQQYMLAKFDEDKILMGAAVWGGPSSCQTFSQLVESIHRAHDNNFGIDTPASREHAWVFDFLKALEDSVEDIDQTLEFISYKVGNCMWVNFEAAALPSNFAALGDARMRVNPIFGQGVAKLASDAVVLNATLRSLVRNGKIPDNFSRQYFDRELPSAKGMYDITRMLDYGHLSTMPQAGEDLEFGGWFRRYWTGIIDIVGKDSVAAGSVWRVLGGLEPGIDLFHPRIAFRVYASKWLVG